MQKLVDKNIRKLTRAGKASISACPVKFGVANKRSVFN